MTCGAEPGSYHEQEAMPFELTWQKAAIGGAIFITSLVVTTVVAGILLVRIRPDYFVAEHRGIGRRVQSTTGHLLLVVGKNVLGVVLVAMGVVLSLPGIPGQGILTILVGLFLVDLPAKRKLELQIVRRPRIRCAIDKLRDRFGAAPILVDRPEEPVQPEDEGAGRVEVAKRPAAKRRRAVET